MLLVAVLGVDDAARLAVKPDAWFEGRPDDVRAEEERRLLLVIESHGAAAVIAVLVDSSPIVTVRSHKFRLQVRWLLLGRLLLLQEFLFSVVGSLCCCLPLQLQLHGFRCGRAGRFKRITAALARRRVLANHL